MPHETCHMMIPYGFYENRLCGNTGWTLEAISHGRFLVSVTLSVSVTPLRSAHSLTYSSRYRLTLTAGAVVVAVSEFGWLACGKLDPDRRRPSLPFQRLSPQGRTSVSTPAASVASQQC